MLFVVLLVLHVIASTQAVKGVDFAGAMSVSSARCLVENNIGDFAIVRAWHSYGAFDTDCPGAVSNLLSAGISKIDVYMFPCPTKDVAQQMKDMVAALKAHNVRFGNIWLDIEEDPSTGCGWSTDKSANCLTMKKLAEATNATGFPWGTYTSTYEWSTIMGSCVVPIAAAHRLWYPHYEKPENPSFSDFKPFGGWTAPYMKQFTDTDGGKCVGGQVDISWRP